MKTVLLMGGLMGLCMGIAYLLGGPQALLPALILGGALNLIAFFYSDKIALTTMRARPVSRQEDPVLVDAVERLAREANMPVPRVYVSPAQAPNAFATGRSPSHSAVCVTTGLRNLLNDKELEGVVAHELAHIRHRDVLISTIAAVVAGAITYLTYLSLFFGGGRDRRGGHPLVALLLMILAPLAAGLIRMAISRSREYEADRFGARLVGSPRPLASALQKLAYGSSRIPLPVPDAQSGLFIVAPFTGSETQKLFMTHPPVDDRVAKLMAMEQ
ncbi:MAG: zinc metalloprotease HtpX [Phycisphaerae bacterium]